MREATNDKADVLLTPICIIGTDSFLIFDLLASTILTDHVTITATALPCRSIDLLSIFLETGLRHQLLRCQSLSRIGSCYSCADT